MWTVSLVPRPIPFSTLWFVLTIMHRSGRITKNIAVKNMFPHKFFAALPLTVNTNQRAKSRLVNTMMAVILFIESGDINYCPNRHSYCTRPSSTPLPTGYNYALEDKTTRRGITHHDETGSHATKVIWTSSCQQQVTWSLGVWNYTKKSHDPSHDLLWNNVYPKLAWQFKPTWSSAQAPPFTRKRSCDYWTISWLCPFS